MLDAVRSLDAMRSKRAFLVMVRFNTLRGVAMYCAITHGVMLRHVAVRSLDAMRPKRAFCVVSSYRAARGIPRFGSPHNATYCAVLCYHTACGIVCRRVIAHCVMLCGTWLSHNAWYFVMLGYRAVRHIACYCAITQRVVLCANARSRTVSNCVMLHYNTIIYCGIMRVLCYGTLRDIVWYVAVHNYGTEHVASLRSRTATHCVGAIPRCRVARYHGVVWRDTTVSYGAIPRCRVARYHGVVWRDNTTRCVIIEGVASSNTDLCLKHHSQIDLCKNGQNCFKRIGGVRSFEPTLILIVDKFCLHFAAYYLRQEITLDHPLGRK